MNLIQFLLMKLHQGPVFIDGVVTSVEVVVHSKTNFVKVVQNQLLLRKQDRHETYREIETNLGVSGTSIHSILHEHLTIKKFVRVGSNTICQSIKKGSCRLIERNAPKKI